MGPGDRPPMRRQMEQMVQTAQQSICAALEQLDGSSMEAHRWERPGGGGGETRVLQGGNLFEKAGVNVSVVHGELPAAAARSMGGGARIAGGDETVAFFAAGLSVVVHPHSPLVPTAHCNYRYFEIGSPDAVQAWWFGGGADLTPCYLFDDDVIHFHRTLRAVCDRFDPAYYPRFKEWCDRYFQLPHRGECRGMGGIFFDDLHDKDAELLYTFCSACAAAFMPAYRPLVERHCDAPYTDEQKRWQQLRRGRYVEFNLLYDRGTAFGLSTGGRTESILMSLPLTARWEYEHEPEPGTAAAALLDVLRTPREWVQGRPPL